jgi:FkbM family methyltransferase
MLARLWTREQPVFVVDGGAHDGATARRVLEIFPNARVAAFEPVGESFDALSAVATEQGGVLPVRAALGDRVGAIDINVNKNLLTCSVLTPTDRGMQYYGEMYELDHTERVPLTTIDAWAAERGVDQIDVLKLDLQGYELAALRGATRALESGVVAVYSEAQFLPEYEGAATFTDIDLFLREHGFSLHQIHEVWKKGYEQQCSYCNALWIRSDVLERLRERAKDLDRERWRDRMRETAQTLVGRGASRVILYGAGTHTRATLPVAVAEGLRIEAIIDDNPASHGSRIDGIPIVPLDRAISMNPDAIVLSANSFEEALWTKAAKARSVGIDVVRMYGIARPVGDARSSRAVLGV